MTKIYKDPARLTKVPYKPYVPAYQVHGFTPTEISTSSIDDAKVEITKQNIVTSFSNPRVRPAPVLQKMIPFADISPMASPIGNSPIPNTGNNMENSWVSVDGDEFDDVFIEEDQDLHKAQLDPNHPMIDNNIDDEINYINIPNQITLPIENNSNNSLDIGENECVLIIAGSIIKIGSLEIVQEEVRKLVFGEHELNKENNINLDDIIVLKRIKIKIGVFLDN